MEDIYCMSRNGRLLDVPEASKDALALAISNPMHCSSGFVIDGELTIKDSVLVTDRGNITGLHNSAIAKKAGKNSSLSENWSRNVTFNAFDILTYKEFFETGTQNTLKTRKENLVKLLGDSETSPVCIKLAFFIESTKEQLQEKTEEAYKKILEAGGEGLIVKDADFLYSFDKENSGWYKVKPRYSCDLRVVGYTLSDDPLLPGGLGALIAETEDGLIRVKIGSGFNLKDRGYYSTEELDSEGNLVLKYHKIDGYSLDDWIDKIVEMNYFGVTHTKDKDNNSLFLPGAFTEEQRQKYLDETGVEYSIIREDKFVADYAKDLIGFKA